VIVPADRQAIGTAVQVAGAARRPCVVWLDDLERFLGTGGLTLTDVRSLMGAESSRHCVLASMRAEEYARFTRAAAHRDDTRIRDAVRHADSFGIAEYLAAGSELVQDWQSSSPLSTKSSTSGKLHGAGICSIKPRPPTAEPWITRWRRGGTMR
jgi:hypothetical protein